MSSDVPIVTADAPANAPVDTPAISTPPSPVLTPPNITDEAPLVPNKRDSLSINLGRAVTELLDECNSARSGCSSARVLSARDQLLQKAPLSARLSSARRRSSAFNSARRPSTASMELVDTTASKRAVGESPTRVADSPRLRAELDKLFHHRVSSDDDTVDDSDHDGHIHEDEALQSSRVAFAIDSALQSEPSDDGRGAIRTSTATTSSTDVSTENHHEVAHAYSFPALQSARETPRSRGEGGGRTSVALQRARRASSKKNSLPFVSVYVDELPFTHGAYVALFFQRGNVSVKLSKTSKMFFAVELYNARLTLDGLEQYDERMAKIPKTDMVYTVDRISTEQISVSHVEGERTVDVWFEMTSNAQGMYIRVAATYTTVRARMSVSLVALEFRPMHDVDNATAYRSFGVNTVRESKLPPIFLTPQLFVNDAPRIGGCTASIRKNRLIALVWSALREKATADWENYVRIRELFVQDYSSLVDRASRVEAAPLC